MITSPRARPPALSLFLGLSIPAVCLVACSGGAADTAAPATPVGETAEARAPTKGTPEDFTARGPAGVSAPRRCPGRSPPVDVITVALRGQRPLILGEGCVKCAEGARFARLSSSDASSPDREALVKQKCGAAPDPAEPVCKGVFFDAFGQAIAQRAAAEGIATTGIGIGACDFADARLSVSIDDWRSANRLARIVAEEGARWDVGGSLAVVVRGISIVTPL